MELLDGENLRARLRRPAFTWRKALEVVAAVAEGLAAAHARGIIHRDLKPENIFLTKDGQVKVLDVGIARVQAVPATQAPAAASTVTCATVPGTVLGTVGYMSPEQARGLEVDARSDVFSLGVVLYELVAGRPPFAGTTASDVIAAILTTEPPPLVRSVPEVPAELERIVRKALRKDPGERYQVIHDLALDLKGLKHELELEAELGRRFHSGSGGRGGVGRGGGQVETAHTVSSAEYLVSEVKRHKWGAGLAFAMLALAAAGLIYGLYRPTGRPRFQRMNQDRLTTHTKALEAAISPDGKLVVYAKDDAGRQSLRLIQVATRQDSPYVLPDDVEYLGLTFSHDGNYVYFSRRDKREVGDLRSAVYQMPSLGGTHRRLIPRVDSAITLSPDDKRLAFVRNDTSRGESLLITANADGSGAQELASRRMPNFFLEPAWSPDGQTIACSAQNNVGDRITSVVVAVSLAGGTVKPITDQEWAEIRRVAWFSDGSDMMVVAKDPVSRLFQLWQVSYPGGEAQKIKDLYSYRSLSLTKASDALVSVHYERFSHISILRDGDAGPARRIIDGWEEGMGLAWTADGKIVYRSLASGNPDIWMIGVDGSDKKQLTFDPAADYQPAADPSGHYIFFASYRAGTSNIWRMAPDGSPPTRLTRGIYDAEPNCSPDGCWVVYTDYGAQTHSLWKISVDGSQKVHLTDMKSNWPVFSPDGQWIACLSKSAETDNKWRIMIIPSQGGQPIKPFLALPPTALGSDTFPPFRWDANGRALIYVDRRDGVSNLWSLPIDGGPPKPLTTYVTSESIFNYDQSHDGQQFALTRGEFKGDVVLISDH
jgi:Tol biopolymer transport system component